MTQMRKKACHTICVARKKYAHKKQESVTSICKDNLVVRWKAAERCVEAENQLVLANVNLDKVSISELFKIGVDLNDMSSVSTMRIPFIVV